MRCGHGCGHGRAKTRSGYQPDCEPAQSIGRAIGTGAQLVYLPPGGPLLGALCSLYGRLAVERLSVFSGIRRIPVTVSIGISPITSKDRGVDDVLRRADRALYRAKADGRNCVRCQDAIVVGRAEGASMAATGG
jgi:hypothetical protein